MTKRKEERYSKSAIAQLDKLYVSLERVIMAWAKCTTDYTDETGDELWFAVNELTSANIAAKFEVLIRPEGVALFRTALYGFMSKPARPKALGS
jgi:hypothetical protein